MVPQHLLKSVVALGRASAEHGYVLVGAGIVLSERGLAWLIVPRSLIDPGDQTVQTAAPVPELLVLIAAERGERRHAVDINAYTRLFGIGWTTGGPENPFAAFPLPPGVARSAVPLPQDTWCEDIHPEPGVRCWGIQDASVLPGDFGPLVLDGIICSVENAPGRTALTTIPSLPGSLGMPIITESTKAFAAADSTWRIAGCITRRIRVPGGRRSSNYGRAEVIEHFGVIEPLGKHATVLIDAALRRLVEVLNIDHTKA